MVASSISKLLWLALYTAATMLAVNATAEVSIVEGTPRNVTVIDIESEFNLSGFYIAAAIGDNRHVVFHAHFSMIAGKVITLNEVNRDTIAAELNRPHLPVVFNITFSVIDFNQLSMIRTITKTLRVLDLDNNEPRFVGFENKPYPIMLSEGESGYEILPLVADGDEGVNSTQNYTLHLCPDLGCLFVLEVKHNEDTGIVTEVRLVQNGTLDREQVSNYMLQIIATEGNVNPQSTILMINVTVLDVCDETPTFPNSNFYTTIKENSPSGTVLLSNITATDTDMLDVGKIRYRISLLCHSRYEDSDCFPRTDSPFQLDRETGDLTLITDGIDREMSAKYEITIIAGDSCMREVTATVIVLVENVNDNPPILVLLGSRAIYETQVVNSTIFFFSVRDDDYGRDRESPSFSIILHENSTGVLLDTDVFFLYHIGDKLELRLGQGLDREAISGYSLVINTTDWGTPNISSIDHLLIEVIDVNDNPPIFQPVDALYPVDEETVLGTTIAEVSATDRDSSESGYGQVSYSIPPSNDTFPYQDYLTVDPNGHLMVAQRIDREEQATFFVLVKAQDNPDNNPLTDYVVVNIRLIDINDNTPTITLPHETVSIVESQPVGSVVLTISAYDNDTEPFSTITYSFTTPENIPFQIDSSSGNITLTTSLDYETQTNYSFEVTASDGRNEERRRVNIQVENINDERCIFDELASYTTSVHEERPSNLLVFNIVATDRDTPVEQLRFSIVAGNDRNHFVINGMSGAIFTTQSLDNEMVSNYSLQIRCSDGSDSPTTTSVYLQVIDINDNIPQFVNIPYTFTVSENLGRENLVGTVLAVDADSSSNAAIRYSVVETSPAAAFGWFTLDPNSGRIMTNRTLDREDAILQGRNGLVTLNVQAANLPTGDKTLSNNSIVSITIADQNDHPPVFEQMTLTMTVRENFVVGNALPERASATDRDSPPNNIINYEISGDTPQALTFFRVNVESGVIVLKTALDFETKQRHEFIVLAVDPNMATHRASQTVVVNVMAPEVNITLVNFHHSVHVQENSPINHRVTQFGVTDNSGNPIMRTVDVTYTITHENGMIRSDDFGLMNDTENSMLIVYVKRNIDREALPVGHNGLVQRVLNITVKSITHGSVSVNLTVTIQDQNDNSPVFSLPSYTFNVNENNDVSVPIGSVSAMDVDLGVNGSAGISFQVADSTAFQVTVDGELRSTRSLDHETRASHNFDVIALDGAIPPMTSHVTIKVVVGDLNDNRPIFNPSQNRTFFVGEETRINTVVATLSVSDADSHLYGPVKVFIGEVLSQHFRIEPNGSITLIQSLDRETTDSHFFTVTARDVGGKSSTANVTIIVEDYNDNVPVFNPIHTAILDENQQENVVFLTVNATDADIGYSGTLMYAIADYTLSRTFCINRMTGDIRLCFQHISCQNEEVTNFERRSMYTLNVVAYDLGIPRHIVSNTVSIIIRPVNEHPPLFDRDVLFVYVDETQGSNVEVARIRAVDQDKDDHVTYQVLNNNQQSDLFRYDAVQGAIMNNGNLDYAVQVVHNITLRATDSGSKMDSVLVIITVNNINNHPPVFHPNSQPNSLGQPLMIKESTPISTVVWTIRASDDDNATHDAVSYHIGGSDDALPFMIDSLTGEISINQSLDYEHEQKHLYTLRIYARDTGSPQMTSSTTVWISIQNENDMLPVFNSTSYSFSVAENEPAMTVVGRVYAQDRDIGDYGIVRYSISQGINDFFDVDPTNGDIFTLRVIDREVLASNDVLFTVRAIDGAPGLDVNTAIANVEVVVTDLNDNAPLLTAAQYLISISPDQEPFILISTPISASDRDQDANAKFYYTVEGSSSNLAINVSSVAGQLMLKERVPSEYQLVYAYTLRAVDRRDPNLFTSARLELLVETDNDHHPRFNPMVSTTYVSELSGSGTEVFVVSSVVTDADTGDNGHLSYTFAQSYPQFAINSESGRISLRERLNFEGIKVYSLTVQAMDSRVGIRRTATGVVRVNVSPGNEFEPRFVNLVSELTLSYLPDVGLELFTVTATDQDEGPHGDVSYSIIDPNRYFAVDHDQGVVKNLMTFESDQRFTVIIEARDAGNPFQATNATIEIIVRSAGSSSPSFIGMNPRHITKPEDITLGSFINTALITNPSAQSYHLVKQTIHEDTTPIEKFTITEGQGRLSIIETLDYEETSKYSIVVEARVTTSGSSSIQRASDFLHIILMVTNVNDNEPVFTVIGDQVFSESTPVSTAPLFQVEATDKDLGLEGMLVYDIIQGDGERTFNINSSTGHVYLGQQLDREVTSSYNLLIQTRDLSNQPHSSQIVIRVTVTDENDFVTTYGGRNYSLNVYEFPSTSPGDRIVKLPATDLDEGPPLRYEMDLLRAHHNGMPQNIDNLRSSFVIDTFSGLISVGTLALDRESVDMYLFTVKATDRVNMARTYLTIRILDVNDNEPDVTVPDFRVRVMEGMPSGILVTDAISSTDADVGINSWVKYSLGNGWPQNYFKIDPVSGVIRTNDVIIASSSILSFSGSMIVEDQGIGRRNKVTKSIYITIVDVNNHAPMFQSDTITLMVSITAIPGTEVHKFNVTDEDFTVNASPLMFLIPHYFSDAINNFRIDAGGGTLALIRPQTEVRSFNFRVDVSNPSFSPSCVQYMQASSINVTIIITPINTACPVFSQAQYILSVAEGEPDQDHVLIRITATDVDGDSVSYTIADSEAPFTIHSTTGDLIGTRPLDRETLDNYQLTILSTDSGNPTRTCSAYVSVIVADVNDNRPIFTMDEYTRSLRENSAANTSAVRVTANDLDLGGNGSVSYHLTPNNLPFHIDSNTGEIFVSGLLDYEAKLRYTFDVVASDGGNPASSSSVPINIFVIDVNEGAPKFTAVPENPIRVNANMVKGSHIYTVQARDPDTRTQLYFSFVNIAPMCYFEINNITGEVTLKVNPNSENKCSSTTTAQPSTSDPSYFIVIAVVSVTDGETSLNTTINFSLHKSFGTPFITTSQSFPTMIIIATVIGILVVAILFVGVMIIACICRAKRSKVEINATTPESIELKKKFGSTRSSNGNNVSMSVYKQTSLGPLPPEHTTMTVAASDASSTHQSYVCNGDSERGRDGRGGALGVHDRVTYPSPGVVSNKSQQSKPYRSTSDLGSSTMATDKLSNGSQETAPYPKSQIERIYAKNADLLDSGSNESIHMFGSEGGGESDGGDDLYGKFNDLDDDDDSTTMQDDDDEDEIDGNEDRDYRRRTIQSTREGLSVNIPPVEGPYPPYSHGPAWAPRTNNMAGTIDQITYGSEKHMPCSQPFVADEFSKSQGGMSGYQGGSSIQESTQSLLRHAHHHPHRHHQPEQHPQPEFYYDDVEQVHHHDHRMMRGVPPKHSLSSGPLYSPHNSPQHLSIGRHPGGGMGKGGGSSQEVPPAMGGGGGYGYHGDYIHHPMHLGMGTGTISPSSTPTEEALNTRALTNEYESDMMYSSDTSLNTNTENDPPQQRQQIKHPHQQLRGPPRGFSQPGPNQRVFSQPGSSQRNAYH